MMINPDMYVEIQDEIEQGRLSKALDLLLEVTTNQDHPLKEDVQLLKSKFEFNSNQYSVKGILTNQEFNIHFSKTVLATQEILDQLKTGKLRIEKSSPTSKSFKYWKLLLLFTTAIILGVLWWGKQAESNNIKPIGETKNDLVSSNNLSEKSPDKDSTETQLENQPKKKDINNVKTVKKQSGNEIPPAVKTEITIEEKPVPKISTQFFDVLIVRNSAMADANIFVDGKKATIVSQSPIITTIRVDEKKEMHTIELIKDDNICKKEMLIVRDKQKIIFNC